MSAVYPDLYHQPPKPETPQERLQNALWELRTAEAIFNEATDPRVIDEAIARVDAARARLRRVLAELQSKQNSS